LIETPDWPAISATARPRFSSPTICRSRSAEHALVNKTARVVEEVGLKKIGSDHVETIRDKLRRQAGRNRAA
jgi:hypothetical protein